MNSKQVVKSTVLVLERYLGVEWLRDRIWATRSTLPAAALLFHRVTNKIPEDGITISTERFRAIIRSVAQHYNPMSLSKLVDHLERGETWPPRTVVVTFDDGYRDNYEFAAPILAEYNVPTTFFLTTDAIGSEDVMPWDECLPRHVPWMDWHQVRELHAQGFEIGSHTLTHPDLGQLRGPQARAEIADSKSKLEDALGAAAAHFAYPFGGKKNFCEENRELVRRAGYRSCSSAYGGFITPKSDAFDLQRIGVNNWVSHPSDLDFEIRIAAPWRWRRITDV